MRQYPSETQTRIKRNFFNSEARRMNLDLFVEVYKGTYASIRMNESIKRGGCGLGVNVDVANTAFWKEMPMIELVCRYLGWIDRRKWGNLKVEQLGRALRPVKTDKGTYGPSEAFTMLRKLHKLRFTVRHRNQKDKKAPKVYIINSFAFDNAYGADGGCASMVKFDWDGRKVTVAEYFREHYDCPLDFADLPVISTTRAGMFPLEICNVSPLERYQYKLDGEQTSKMIKFAVTRPTQRKQDIMDNQAKLCWDKDPYMKQFGLTIDDRMAKVEAKLIANPEIQFGNAKHNPGTTGRWDLRGKRFLTPNLHPLRSWAFVNTERAVNMRQVQEFANSFSKIYQGHGGKVAAPAMLLDFSNITNMAKAVSDARQKLMLANQSCQMLVFILGVVNSGQYERIKKSADCRFGIMTQCVLAAHVERNSGQYHSNLAMKINAKLGGATCRALPPRAGPNNPSLLPTSGPMTMMIGVDVSHAAPGSPVASMAAMTMSIDRETTRYAASCDTNGYRVEMLTEDNVKRLMGNLYTQWTAQGNGAPGHVYYFRDGVAESQYIHVLNQEVAPIRAWFKAKNITPKFTVVVATKRHHIRIFPAQGDRNQNPFPGTLVETEVTHPFQWDFYLCSHAAIQGTARPVHYTVIMDEAKCQPNQLQRLIYAQCYQYIRSTTPVSLHPAVYYAHLASNRARFHEHVSTQTGGHRSGGKAVEVQHDSLAKGAATGATVAGEARNTQSQRIMELGGSRDATQADRLFIQKTMWFI
jgi:eukaryotic translation initiation factor 2C